MLEMPRVIIVPGNGCSPVYDANWYAFMKQKLDATEKFSEVILRDMPDPMRARESIWLPFIRHTLLVDENTIFIGHSSGAVAGMRLLEDTKLLGCVLVAACHTDLGDMGERLSGYYNRAWKWNKIKSNAN